MKLKDLNLLAVEAKEAFNSYNKQEIVLSSEFKIKFKELIRKRSSEKILFSNTTSIIETAGGLTITFPNQWFFIASYFTKYLIALKVYKEKYNIIFQGLANARDIVRQIKETKKIPADIEKKIGIHFSELSDREYFKKFLSDYEWWHGNKTIDRGDYYVSPILGLSKVVNVSQSYIADLTNFLSEDDSLLNSLRKSSVSEMDPDDVEHDPGKEEVIEETSSIRDFALNVFKHFYGKDWIGLIKKTKSKNSKINSTNFISHTFDIFTRLLAEFTAPQRREELTSSGTQRYFEEPVFTDGDRHFYFTTQWNGDGDYDLSFDSLKEYFESKYPEYRFEKTDRTYRLVKGELLKKRDFDFKEFYRKSIDAKFHVSEKLFVRYVSSLLTKPFVILTGLSGSGKTKLAQAFAMWICENEDQYCIVPVGADWTNREPLLGFPNALIEGVYVKPDNGVLDLIIDANENPEKPYFLILDEMNLSHVERYFADFLSVMESKTKISLHTGDQNMKGVPGSLGFPKNLFIIGTVNIDETTYMFSPKVLDRASVIEFRVSSDEMSDYLQSNTRVELENLEGGGKDMAQSFVEIAKDTELEIEQAEEINKILLIFFNELKKAGAEFGYRSASEILRFAAVVEKLGAGWINDEIADAAIMQKLLPKLHGSRKKLADVLITIGSLCLNDQSSKLDTKDVADILSKEFNDDVKNKIKYPVSFEKVSRMYRAVLINGFTSYAEA